MLGRDNRPHGWEQPHWDPTHRGPGESGITRGHHGGGAIAPVPTSRASTLAVATLVVEAGHNEALELQD